MEDENDRSTEGDVKMVNKNLVKILDLYKEEDNGGRSRDHDRALSNEDHESLGLPWEDDGKLRIVAIWEGSSLKRVRPWVRIYPRI